MNDDRELVSSAPASEADQLQAIASLPAEVALIKMENEQIFSVAKSTPRVPATIVAQLTELIDAYPAAAEQAIYNKPVGTVQVVTCANRKCGIQYEVNKVEKDTLCPACDTSSIPNAGVTKRKKFARGLSIRAAESIRSIFGYTRLATSTEVLDDGKVRITGTLVDYAAGNITTDSRIVSPYYRARSGQMTRTPEDRFLNVVVKAEKAKLRRDVILDSVPNIVKAALFDECDRRMAELISPEVVAQRILPAFSEHGISVEHLDKILGRPKALGWRTTERLQLREILNALKQGETTPRELLAGLDDDKKQIEGPQGGATMDDLTRPSTSGHVDEAPKKPATKKPAGKKPVAAEPSTSGQGPDGDDEKSWLEGIKAAYNAAKTLKACDELHARVCDTGTDDQIETSLLLRDERKHNLRQGRGGKLFK